MNKNEHDQENLVSVYRIISYRKHKKVLVLQIGSANNKNSLLTNTCVNPKGLSQNKGFFSIRTRPFNLSEYTRNIWYLAKIRGQEGYLNKVTIDKWRSAQKVLIHRVV